MRSSWITWLGPKSKWQVSLYDTEEGTLEEEMEAEIGVL